MRTIGAVSLLMLAGVVQAWAAGPVDQTFQVKKVHLDGLVAQVTFDTAPAGPVRIQADGKPEVLKRLEVHAIGDEVVVHLEPGGSSGAWFPWNLFNEWSENSDSADLQVHVSAPSGTPVEIEDMVGRVVAGDLDAPLSLEGSSLHARFGRVSSARVSVAGSGEILVGAVRQELNIEVEGSGKFEAASAGSASVHIAGGGDVKVGPIATSLTTEVAGSGDVRVAAVNGPVDVSVAGSGSVYIDSGRAAPLKVEIAGSGDVVLKGEAVDPSVSILGSGSVKVRSMSGRLSKEIAGSGDFEITGQPAPPLAPAPAAPALPPTPPAKPH